MQRWRLVGIVEEKGIIRRRRELIAPQLILDSANEGKILARGKALYFSDRAPTGVAALTIIHRSIRFV
jgi:hypothetical protein